MLGNRCPGCREARLFKVRNPYRLRSVNDMHASCPRCGVSFLREPGFYFGAAYVNYAMTVALWVAVLVALYVFGALGWITFTGLFDQPETVLFSGIATLLLLLPPVQRLSRSIWIHFFVRYRGG
jgi:DNA-directed RNA polymerase subunit RPC12/RpoP